jgi:hypothetical protein
MDYSAIGQTTHLAARMEQLATLGSIRLTAGTLRLVEGLVQVTTLGRFPVKGLRNGGKITFRFTCTEGLPSSAMLGGPSPRRLACVF